MTSTLKNLIKIANEKTREVLISLEDINNSYVENAINPFNKLFIVRQKLEDLINTVEDSIDASGNID